MCVLPQRDWRLSSLSSCQAGPSWPDAIARKFATAAASVAFKHSMLPKIVCGVIVSGFWVPRPASEVQHPQFIACFPSGGCHILLTEEDFSSGFWRLFPIAPGIVASRRVGTVSGGCCLYCEIAVRCDVRRHAVHLSARQFDRHAATQAGRTAAWRLVD